MYLCVSTQFIHRIPIQYKNIFKCNSLWMHVIKVMMEFKPYMPKRNGLKYLLPKA